MAKRFNELRERLLRAGVAPRHVRRYLAELGDHLVDLTAEEVRAGRSRVDAESAALLRLGKMEDLARAMTEQRQFQAWCVRAPWAIFGLAPLFLLAGAYLLACLILWSGWEIFLPGTEAPFVKIQGFAGFYFGVGRLLYFYSPILIGWGIVLFAARQRLQAAWPAVGLILIAWIGGTAQVHASRQIPGAGHIRMNFDLAQGFSESLSHVLAIFTLTLLPYLFWRIRKAHSLST